jgi:hypothetical protein
MGLVFLRGLTSVSSMIQNLSKGTIGETAFIGQDLLSLLLWLIFLSILLVPAWLLQVYCNETRSRECNVLEKRLANEPKEEEKESLREQLDLAYKQTPWPKGDNTFKALFVLA